MPIELKILKANNGDCIWLRYGKIKPYCNIIIDSGPVSFQRQFRELLNTISENGEHVDLLVISHIDNDHLGGFSKWISNSSNDTAIIKKIWFNTGNSIKASLKNPDFASKEFPLYLSNSNQEYSVKCGKEVSQQLAERNIDIIPIIKAGHVEPLKGAEITVLSPTQEKLEELLRKWDKNGRDTEYMSSSVNSQDLKTLMENDIFIPDNSPFNGSSIAFILKYENVHIAFLADAHVSTIIEEKEKIFGKESLDVDIMKLSHHGSSSNAHVDLFHSIRTDNYIVSSNGSNDNPDKRTIARILKANRGKKVNLYSNYNWWSNRNIFTKNDFDAYIDLQLLNRIELTSKLITVSEGLVIGNA